MSVRQPPGSPHRKKKQGRHNFPPNSGRRSKWQGVAAYLFQVDGCFADLVSVSLFFACFNKDAAIPSH